MFASLKAWANLDLIVHPYTARSGMGTKQFAVDVPIKCYAKGDMVSIKNRAGEEVTSNTQLYVEGAYPAISALDEVTFSGTRYPIEHVARFFSNGKVDLQVVYL